MDVKEQTLTNEIMHAINRVSRENASNTPDFILAEYLMCCLSAFEIASTSREKWYGKSLSIGGSPRQTTNASPARVSEADNKMECSDTLDPNGPQGTDLDPYSMFKK